MLRKLQDDGIIIEIKKPRELSAPIVLVSKRNDKVRICVDLTKLNENVKKGNFPLPTTFHLLAKLSGARNFTLLDCNISGERITAVDNFYHSFWIIYVQKDPFWNFLRTRDFSQRNELPVDRNTWRDYAILMMY